MPPTWKAKSIGRNILGVEGHASSESVSLQMAKEPLVYVVGARAVVWRANAISGSAEVGSRRYESGSAQCSQLTHEALNATQDPLTEEANVRSDLPCGSLQLLGPAELNALEAAIELGACPKHVVTDAGQLVGHVLVLGPRPFASQCHIS